MVLVQLLSPTWLIISQSETWVCQQYSPSQHSLLGSETQWLPSTRKNRDKVWIRKDFVTKNSQFVVAAKQQSWLWTVTNNVEIVIYLAEKGGKESKKKV